MKPERPPVRALLYAVYFIYFFCGMTQCFEGVFLPEFKEYFRLNYQQQMYTMFAKNIPFVLAVAIGYLVKRVGYKNCMTLAMALFGAGTLVLIPGLQTHDYPLVLLGFFLIGVGFNCELVAGNPMLSALGTVRDASSRLNLGNALGAVAQIIAPATLSLIIPAAVVSVQGKLPYMQGLFAALGIVLLAVALVTALMRDVDIAASFTEAPDAAGSGGGNIWTNFHLLAGFFVIFLTLGIEAGLFSFYRNFLEDPAVAALTAHQSQRMFTIYFALFALGRLAGAWVQRKIRPAAHLLFCLAAALVCLAGVVLGKGNVAVAAVTAIGFFISVFFPTLYALAIGGMGERTGQASGLLTMGFVGCALMPVLQGRLADTVGLQNSYALGVAAYLVAGLYAFHGYRAKDPAAAAVN
ncbi:MAG: MFS transporter [Terracidiphilus sp.]|nr:MFS transporter [Terracidiphilus sp.]